jgi:hypothetical protein
MRATLSALGALGLLGALGGCASLDDAVGAEPPPATVTTVGTSDADLELMVFEAIWAEKAPAVCAAMNEALDYVERDALIEMGIQSFLEGTDGAQPATIDALRDHLEAC